MSVTVLPAVYRVESISDQWHLMKNIDTYVDILELIIGNKMYHFRNRLSATRLPYFFGL